MSTSRVAPTQGPKRREREAATRPPGVRKAYLPSQEEIRQVCEQIRSEWSADEWAKREGERYKSTRIPLVKSRHLPMEGDKPADEEA